MCVCWCVHVYWNLCVWVRMDITLRPCVGVCIEPLCVFEWDSPSVHVCVLEVSLARVGGREVEVIAVPVPTHNPLSQTVDRQSQSYCVLASLAWVRIGGRFLES